MRFGSAGGVPMPFSVKRDLTARMVGASILLAVLVGAVLTVLAVTLYGFRGTANRARHSEEVLATANRLERVVLDLETGERGFLLTRQQSFLEPWRTAGKQLPVEADRLETLAAGDPAQERRADGIEQAALAYYANWSVPIVRLTQRDPQAAVAKVATGAGKRRVDAIRLRFDRFIAVERRLLDSRREAATAGGRRAAFVGLAGLVVSALLILAFTVYLARQIVVPLRRLAGAARDVATGNLRTRVPEGGPGELGALAEAFNSMASSLEATHEQLAGQNAELARRAGINRAVLAATNEAIGMYDLSGRPLMTNPAMDRFLALVGVDGERRLNELAARVRVATKDPQSFWSAIGALLDDPAFETAGEFELVKPRKVFASFTGPVRDGDGTIIGRLFVIRDVTEEREADRLKTELVATVSHELRTPLASILGYAELMVTGDHDPDATQKYAQTVHRQAQRLTDLINDFLDLQRIESRRLPLQLESFELEELLEEQIEAFSGQSAEHRLVLRSSDGSALVHADRERVAQVVGNLLSNAVKYSPDGGLVEVVLSRPDGRVRVEVTDEGLGIPDEQQSEIFTRFFRVDSPETHAIGGTGLGLAFSRELVLAQGGWMGFESSPGSGSTFWFELPAAEAERLRRAV
jgi:signal transduction histidine kinase/CHASE3 domain sensor protein